MNIARIGKLALMGLLTFGLPIRGQSLPTPTAKVAEPTHIDPLTKPASFVLSPDNPEIIPPTPPATAPDCIQHLVPGSGRWELNGWLQGGYLSSFDYPNSHYNGPYNWEDRNELNLNQLYLSVERKLDPNRRFSLGGRLDLLLGSDYFLAQSRGLEAKPNGSPHWNGSTAYGAAMPQAYGEIGVGSFSLKLGHFYSLVGYESVMPYRNFFYSHSYAFQFSQPYTNTGGLITWQADEHLAFTGGLINGFNAFDPEQDNLGFTGGIKVLSPSKKLAFGAAVASNNEPSGNQFIPFPTPTDSNQRIFVKAPFESGNISPLGLYENRTVYSLVLEWQPVEKLQYAIEHQFGIQENGQPSISPALAQVVMRQPDPPRAANTLLLSRSSRMSEALWYGVSQYVAYELSSTTRLGTRFEVFRDEDGTQVIGRRLGNPNNLGYPGTFYAWTLGLNWMPHSNLIVRPELRYDWFSGTGNPYNDSSDRNQFLAGVDVVFRF